MNLVRDFLKVIFLCSLLLSANVVRAEEPKLQVVTSFSILEDLVKTLGGEHVSVTNLVSPNSDAHMYQPKPSDVVSISKADLVIFNGLGFEGWMTRLIQNSGYKNIQLIAGEGVEVIKHGEEVDPHAWQSFKNIRVYLKNITQALISLRPKSANDFSKRLKVYLSAISDLEQELHNHLKTIPVSNRIVVTSHDAFGYLGREFDIRFLAPLGTNLKADASAKDVAALIDQIRQQKVKALFVENINSPRLLKLISSETKVAIGGRLYSDALSHSGGPADTYLKMMRHNLESLVTSFKSSK